MKKRVFEEYLGIIFVIIGFLISLFVNYFCEKLCSGCLLEQDYPCNFLFLFAGIIFIISGTSLVLTSKEKTKSYKKK
ncbi:MAG: hypothetical protein PHF67_02425 [Candidatus Nanoarchaeia archaeon]|nr:hypothetical protein [Candidatus Nanoarchaeia archaeon]